MTCAAGGRGEIEGSTDRIGEEFSYTVPGVHFSRQRVTELEPGHKVSWLVVDSRLDYLQDKQEWNGTRITFDLVPQETGTEVTFVHHGLDPRGGVLRQLHELLGHGGDAGSGTPHLR